MLSVTNSVQLHLPLFIPEMKKESQAHQGCMHISHTDMLQVCADPQKLIFPKNGLRYGSGICRIQDEMLEALPPLAIQWHSLLG